MIPIKMLNEHIAYFTVPFEDIFTTVAILRSENGSILFDAACRQSDVEDYILPALAQLGVKDLKYIFISHNHSDHVGALAWLLPQLSNCTVISRSDVLQQSYPNAKFIQPNDGDSFLEHFRVVTVPGHTPDSIALLDTRTGTLISGDCLQAYGIYGTGTRGASIKHIAPHLQAIHKLRNMDIRTVLASHDYYPHGQIAAGKDAVNAYINSCMDALLRIRDILMENLDSEDGQVAELCNDGKLPTVSVGVVTAIRKALAEGSI